MKKMTVGFVGCGVGGLLHIPALKGVPNIDIIWFCDKNEDQARKAMKLWGRTAKIDNNFERLLMEYKPDVIHICTPQTTHADLSIKSLEAGCHVMLEKPMAISVAEARKILDARDRSGYRLCMMHNVMYDPAVISVKRVVNSGSLGKLICGEARHFYSIKKMKEEGSDDPNHWVHNLKSGVAGEFIPHSIYLLQSFFGPTRKLQLIHKVVDRDEQKSYMRKSWAVQLDFDNAVGRIHCMSYMPYKHLGIDLYGTLGAAHMNLLDVTYSIERERHFLPITAAHMESTVEQSFHKLWQTLANSVSIVTRQLQRRPGHRRLVLAFYDALRSGDPVPVPGEDGLATVQTLDMLDKAMENVQPSSHKGEN